MEEKTSRTAMNQKKRFKFISVLVHTGRSPGSNRLDNEGYKNTKILN